MPRRLERGLDIAGKAYRTLARASSSEQSLEPREGMMVHLNLEERILGARIRHDVTVLDLASRV